MINPQAIKPGDLARAEIKQFFLFSIQQQLNNLLEMQVRTSELKLGTQYTPYGIMNIQFLIIHFQFYKFNRQINSFFKVSFCLFVNKYWVKSI